MPRVSPPRRASRLGCIWPSSARVSPCCRPPRFHHSLAGPESSLRVGGSSFLASSSEPSIAMTSGRVRGLGREPHGVGHRASTCEQSPAVAPAASRWCRSPRGCCAEGIAYLLIPGRDRLGVRATLVSLLCPARRRRVGEPVGLPGRVDRGRPWTHHLTVGVRAQTIGPGHEPQIDRLVHPPATSAASSSGNRRRRSAHICSAMISAPASFVWTLSMYTASSDGDGKVVGRMPSTTFTY